MDKNLEQKIKDIEMKMGSDKYSNQIYDKKIPVSLPGDLFADFVNTQHNNSQLLSQMHQYFSAGLEIIENMIKTNEVMGIKFAEQHIKNVDNGSTRTASKEELKEQSSPEVITSTKESKK